MANIKTTLWLPALRHCQGEAHTHLKVTKNGKVAKEGRGLGFWFWPIGTAISEVPVNDQSVAVTFKTRTQDFQDVSISGQVWYTVTDPGLIASRFDFSINTETGAYNADPLTVIQGALVSAAQEAVWSYVASRTLEVLLQSELAGLSSQVSGALSGLDFGVNVSRAVVTAVRPERSVEEALQAQTREKLQMEADAAGFERRARATEQERAIQEAELANKLAIAKQRETLIAQERANAAAVANSQAEVRKIETQSEVAALSIRSEHEIAMKKANNALFLEHKAAIGKLDDEGLSNKLALYAERKDAAKLLALNRAPEALKNLKVMTLGEGGLQAALESIADTTE